MERRSGALPGDRARREIRSFDLVSRLTRAPVDPGTPHLRAAARCGRPRSHDREDAVPRFPADPRRGLHTVSVGTSLRLFTVSGIPVRVHWTFFLLLGWLFFRPLVGGAENAVIEGLLNTALVLAVFCCVVLHEFGHAFAARWFGIRTRDVTLLPIGGVARLERMPIQPMQELVIALAGPMVNVAIVTVLFPLALLLPGGRLVLAGAGAGATIGEFVMTLAIVNIVLVVFNMIPAFPMDGGRVLRAILTLGMNRVTATRVAARTGQVIAVLLAIVGLYSSPLLVLVAIFVFFGAAAEAYAVTLSERATVDDHDR